MSGLNLRVGGWRPCLPTSPLLLPFLFLHFLSLPSSSSSSSYSFSLVLPPILSFPSRPSSPPSLKLCSVLTQCSHAEFGRLFYSVVQVSVNWGRVSPKTTNVEIITDIPDHMCADLRAFFLIWQKRFKHTLFHFYTFIYLRTHVSLLYLCQCPDANHLLIF